VWQELSGDGDLGSENIPISLRDKQIAQLELADPPVEDRPSKVHRR